jgi:hypothetical protein
MDGSHSRYNMHSFIIRLWREQLDEKTRREIWRGHITHVPDGERRYISTLDGISEFITPYLKKPGGPVDAT